MLFGSRKCEFGDTPSPAHQIDALFFGTQDLGKYSSMGEAALSGKQLHPCWNLVREAFIVQ